MGIENFQWAFAITGLTVAILACLEISINRAVEIRANAHSEGSRRKPKRQTIPGNVDSSSDEEEASGDKYCNTADDPDKDGNSDAAKAQIVKEGAHEHAQHDHEHAQHDHGQVMDTDHPFSSLLLTIALSIHSIIEGLGIGATDDINSLESSFVAVAFHKGFTAFALANGLISSGFWSDKSKRKWFYLAVGTFISVALLGIGIGWAISTTDSSLAVAILTGLTAGSFIYVAALEILPEESATIKRESLPILPVAFFFIAGYCLMALLAVWA